MNCFSLCLEYLNKVSARRTKELLLILADQMKLAVRIEPQFIQLLSGGWIIWELLPGSAMGIHVAKIHQLSKVERDIIRY